MQNFKKLLYLLSRKERKQGILLLLMILMMALLDMLGVASILPFMAVLTNPDLVETNSILNFIFQSSSIFGVENKNQFVFMFGLVVFVLLIVSLAFKALTNYAQTLFITMREYSIGKRLVEGYLNQPYSWFLNRNSADLGKSILSEVGMVIGMGIQPMITLIAHGAVVVALITLLVINDPLLTLISGVALGGTYAFIYIFTRNYLKKIGQERLKANEARFTILSEAFGASKEIKLGRLENIYVNRFDDPAKTFAKHQSSVKIISQLPRFALEAVAFGGMLLLSLYFMSQSGAFINAIPVIALYAFAGYRLMPALQNIYVAFTQLRFAGPALDALHTDLKSLNSVKSFELKDPVKFDNSISLDQIYYHYPNSSNHVLKNIELNIPVRSKVGIVGSTGSGKTTTVDIILGLLQANKGSLKVDEKIIDNSNLRSWQSCIGYVPQHIYLSDDTLAANIAFGVDPKDIIQADIEKASKIANLHEFIISELPKQYQTTIGERGVRLSGGQRQRIGIARALYHNPKVLILDEATSALDNQTEKAVMNEVYNLNKDITIIIIAHRLSTVKKCDQIYLLKNGELENQGTFEELIKVNENFRANTNN